MSEYIIKNKKKLLFFALSVYWFILFVLTTLPGEDLPKSITFNDKLEHLTAFGGLGFLLSLVIPEQGRFAYLKKNAVLATLFIGSLYGALDELHQLFIPGRSCELNDWIADTCGILFGIGLSFLAKKWIPFLRPETK